MSFPLPIPDVPEINLTSANSRESHSEESPPSDLAVFPKVIQISKKPKKDIYVWFKECFIMIKITW